MRVRELRRRSTNETYDTEAEGGDKVSDIPKGPHPDVFKMLSGGVGKGSSGNHDSTNSGHSASSSGLSGSVVAGSNSEVGSTFGSGKGSGRVDFGSGVIGEDRKRNVGRPWGAIFCRGAARLYGCTV